MAWLPSPDATSSSTSRSRRVSCGTAHVSVDTHQKPKRYVAFRLVCLLEAFIFLVLFGMYRSWLSPWVTVPDGADHGWTRTPELHRWADSAASIFFLGLVAALVLLAVRPRGRSGLAAWVIGLIATSAAVSVVSSLLQQHAGVAGACDGAITLVALVGPLVALAPERSRVLRGGRAGSAPPSSAALRPMLLAGLVAFAAVVVGSVAWRLTGGVFESNREDDVISFVLLGVAMAFGCWQVLRRREGWRPLLWIVAAMAMYSVVGATSLLLAG